MRTPANLHLIVGKRVARVVTGRVPPEDTGTGQFATDLGRIYFDDGSYIYLVAHESQNEPYVTGHYCAASQPGSLDHAVSEFVKAVTDNKKSEKT